MINKNLTPVEWIELYSDNWDDYGFKTSFNAVYKKQNKEQFDLGNLRIAYKGMESAVQNPRHETSRIADLLPDIMDELPKDFFSLGASVEYYNNIKAAEIGDSIFRKLQDLAFDLKLFDKYSDESSVQYSFLRSLTERTIKQQLHRISHGGVELTPYNFIYKSSHNIELDFHVKPGSNPPTNVHVIVGRNGSGKTYLIKNMVKSLICDASEYGKFVNFDEDYFSTFEIEESKTDLFANVLCVAFSPFDNFADIETYNRNNMRYSYIGLNRNCLNLLETINNQFMEYFKHCMEDRYKQKRWTTTVQILRSDPAFAEINVEGYTDIWDSKNDIWDVDSVNTRFSRMSSGHKIILLTLTACVDKLEEKSIVFLDEPENHLHPPLLSAFIRALSSLLINRNSVAIISTHSPIVLQEVPKSCVWKIKRSGLVTMNTRIEIETFGGTFSSLAHDVFGLEIEQSGYLKMLIDAVEEYDTYEDVVDTFNGELGDAAIALLQNLIFLKRRKDNI